jgi:transposase-like protein
VIGAAGYERTETRVNARNGSRPRTLSTRAGDIDLRIPKLRKGSFFPLILEVRVDVDSRRSSAPAESLCKTPGLPSVHANVMFRAI